MSKRVNVREYTRWRFGVLEYVVSHTRRWPRQSSFDF